MSQGTAHYIWVIFQISGGSMTFDQPQIKGQYQMPRSFDHKATYYYYVTLYYCCLCTL